MSEKTHKSVVKTYSRMAPEYDKKFASYLDGTFRVAFGTLSLKGSEKILDIACGTGELERRILEKFPDQHITGVDITKSMLSIARRKCRGYPNIRFLHAPAQKLPLDDGKFDIVITCSAFHYMRSPEKVIEECARVLAPEGRLIIIDWCRDFMWAKFYNVLSKIYRRAHYKVYTLRELKQMLISSDFTIASTKTFAIPPFWRMMCVEAKKEVVSRWSSVVGG